MNIVIIGHVDHGKSTLIGRLLYDTNSIPESLVNDVRAISEELGTEMEFAYLLDSLEEERAQNITIDTTQTFFSSEKRDYVIIDAPGHREFLKNMITGASMAEAAVLLVDVNLGMEEQTKRHAYIASLLGLSNLIVVMNKMDTAGFDSGQYEKTKKDVEQFLLQLGIKPIHIIPISARRGDNIATRSQNTPWYKGPAVVEALDALKAAEASTASDLRLPLQDRYNVKGKEIHVGRIEGGCVKVGDKVTVYPKEQTLTVDSIEMWHTDKRSKAESGESIGLTFKEAVKLQRGEVVCSGCKPTRVESFEATVFWMSPNKIDVNQEITLKCATQDIPCVVEKIKTKINSSSLELLGKDCKDLLETEVGEVVIKTKGPVVIESFNSVESLGRFVLVRDDEIEGGGIISETQLHH